MNNLSGFSRRAKKRRIYAAALRQQEYAALSLMKARVKKKLNLKAQAKENSK